MSNDTIRAAITAALRRRGTIDDLDASPSLTLLGSRTSTASVVIYGADGAVVDVVARASDDAKALRGVAFAVGMRVDPCPACNGRGRRAYGREVEDGCDECECSGVVVVDPAEDVDRWRNRAAFAEGEISAALGLPPTMGVAPGELARVLRSTEKERDEAHERAKAAEADVARLEFALQCEATRHEETRAAARTLIGVLGLYDPAIRDGLLTVQMRYIDDAREALRKIVDGDR